VVLGSVRKNPWANQKTRAEMVRGMKLAARKRRRKRRAAIQRILDLEYTRHRCAPRLA
jgi:hypothetical protein